MIGGVNRAENQMPGLGGFQGDITGFAVSHFAHKNHVRILPQGGPNRHAKVCRIGSNLALNSPFFWARGSSKFKAG